jgi:hypothetical protein
MSPRISARVRIVALIRLGIAAVLVLSSVVLLDTVDKAVQGTRASMKHAELGSSVYYDTIHAIVEFRHVAPAVAFLVAAAACVALGAAGLAGGPVRQVFAWSLWLVALVGFCVIAYGGANGFALRPGFNYLLVWDHARRGEDLLAWTLQLAAGIALYGGLPISILIESVGTTAAGRPGGQPAASA